MPKSRPTNARAQSPTRPRLALVEPAQHTADQPELLAGHWGDDVPNLLTIVARHPALFPTWMPFCLELSSHSAFPARERELLIIRTASLRGSVYVLEHHLRMGAEVGLSGDELAAVCGHDHVHKWPIRERLLVAAADELHTHDEISETTWRRLGVLLTAEQLVELPMLVGHYILMAGSRGSLEVLLEDEQIAKTLSWIEGRRAAGTP